MEIPWLARIPARQAALEARRTEGGVLDYVVASEIDVIADWIGMAGWVEMGNEAFSEAFEVVVADAAGAGPPAQPVPLPGHVGVATGGVLGVVVAVVGLADEVPAPVLGVEGGRAVHEGCRGVPLGPQEPVRDGLDGRQGEPGRLHVAADLDGTGHPDGRGRVHGLVHVHGHETVTEVQVGVVVHHRHRQRFGCGRVLQASLAPRLLLGGLAPALTGRPGHLVRGRTIGCRDRGVQGATYTHKWSRRTASGTWETWSVARRRGRPRGIAVDSGSGWVLNAGDAYFYRGEVGSEQYECPPMLRGYQRMNVCARRLCKSWKKGKGKHADKGPSHTRKRFAGR